MEDDKPLTNINEPIPVKAPVKPVKVNFKPHQRTETGFPWGLAINLGLFVAVMLSLFLLPPEQWTPKLALVLAIVYAGVVNYMHERIHHKKQ